MKFPSLLAAVLAFSTLCHADFVIVQSMTSEGPGASVAMDMTMKIKGDKIRVDIGEQSSVIMDSQTSDMVNIMHPQRLVMRMDGSQIEGMAKQHMDAMMQQSGQDPDEKAELVETGNSKEINGILTHEYRQSAAGMDVTYWIARDYPDKQRILEAMKKLQNGKLSQMAPKSMQSDMSDMPGIPLETIASQNGQITTVKVKSIEQTTVDDSAFDVPEGYSDLSMPDMGGMMQKLQQGMPAGQGQ